MVLQHSGPKETRTPGTITPIQCPAWTELKIQLGSR
jgi:hypothetical protein